MNQKEIDELLMEFTKNKDAIREQEIKSAESVETKIKEKKAKLGSKVIIRGSIISVDDKIPGCPYFYENPDKISGVNLLRPYSRSRVIKNPKISKTPYLLGNPIFMH